MNYKGLSPAIGKVGAEKIFKQSVTKHSLHYNFFHGDGDSKAFPAVQNAYSPEEPVKKYECIGHYHERVGTRLQKKDVKGVDGKGCLTNAKINTLQNYFDIALCQNVGDIDKMISACKASVFHVAQLSKISYQYQHDMLNRTSSYKDKDGIPSDVRSAILPVYNDLCKRENLSKCLHGSSQSINKSFNEMIWNRAPKANHVGQSNNV